MNERFQCELTASLLDAGQVIAMASHVGAIVAGVDLILVSASLQRALFGISLAFWLAQCLYAFRVRLDASLFRALAEEPCSKAQLLDAALLNLGLAKPRPSRSIAERSKGARRLLNRQGGMFAAQVFLLFVALAMQSRNSLLLR